MDYDKNCSNLELTKEIIKEYYSCYRSSYIDFYDEPMKAFRNAHPKEYKHLCSVHRCRSVLNKNIEALKTLNEVLYFGTLTFDETKDHNKTQSKRKEAFRFLNSLFEFVLLVEENGEEKGRYHIHFVANFKEGKTFNDFKEGWHSRQNLRILRENESISQYLCKYLSKDLPRVRRNKKLIELERYASKHRRLKRTFPSLYSSSVKQKIFQLTIFDL